MTTSLFLLANVELSRKTQKALTAAGLGTVEGWCSADPRDAYRYLPHRDVRWIDIAVQRWGSRPPSRPLTAKHARVDSYEYCARVGPGRCGTSAESSRGCSGLACRTAVNKRRNR